MAPSQDRRSFLRFATSGLGALFAAILGVPAVFYLIDPRNRKGAPSAFRLVDGVRLDEIGNVPVQGVIRDVRVDGWTLHPNDVIGRVWVVKDPAAQQGARVFTTICPHLGCSVNKTEDCFACPCHNARFNFDGSQIDTAEYPNPALRGMDALEWQPDPEDPQRITVRYESFRAATATKDVIQ